jgi:hypothetical protein
MFVRGFPRVMRLWGGHAAYGRCPACATTHRCSLDPTARSSLPCHAATGTENRL